MKNNDLFEAQIMEVFHSYHLGLHIGAKMLQEIAIDISKLQISEPTLPSEQSCTISYLKSEYDQQLPRITKLLGKKPSVFEQGINAILFLIENPEMKAEQSQEPVKSAEEILDNYSNYATMRGRSCFAIEYTDAVKACEEYRNQPKKNK